MSVTRYRLPSSGTAAVSPAIQSYSHTQTTRRPLPTSDTSALATQAYTPDGSDHLVAGDSHHCQFVSDALATGTEFKVGNTIALCIQGLEAHANNNLFVQIWVGVYSNDGSTLRAVLCAKTSDNTELATSLASRYMSTTVQNAYTTQAGDRLVVEISVAGTPTAASGVQGHNASLRWGGGGSGGDLTASDGQTGTTLNPWFDIQNSFNQTLTPSFVSASWGTFAPSILIDLNLFPNSASAVWNTFTPTVSLGGVALSPDPTAANWSVFQPTVFPGGVTLDPQSVSATYSVLTPSVLSGTNVLSDPAAASFSVSSHQIVQGYNLLPEYAVAQLAAFSASVALGPLTVYPSPVDGIYSVVGPVVVAGPLTVLPESTAVQLAVFDSSVLYDHFVLPDPFTGIYSANPADLATAYTVYPDYVTSYLSVLPPLVVRPASQTYRSHSIRHSFARIGWAP